MAKPIYIKVGGDGPYDPAAGEFDCNIPSLKGMDIYLDNIAPALYSVLSTGGFRMVSAFIADAEFFVQLSGISYGTDATGYTNGFCLNQVMSALFGRVGWLQTPGADLPVLNSTNLISRGGRKFNDSSFHTLVSLKNIKDVMEQSNASDSDFNTFIEGLQRAVILRSLNGVFNPPEFISASLLFDRWGSVDTPIENAGKFIAVRIKVPQQIDLATQIDSVSLYFDTDVTFPLYLFNDSKKAPVWTASVTAIANTQTIVGLTDIVLNHIGANNHGGIFYFGYFQDDLGDARAIRESSSNFKNKNAYGAAMVEVEAINGNDFNREEIGYSGYQTYGLNPHISVFRDHTWQIVKKASLFDNVIGMQMAAQIVEMVLYSTRSNGTERILKESANFTASMDLTGVAPISESPQTTGLRRQIQQELIRVKESFFPKPIPQSIPLC